MTDGGWNKTDAPNEGDIVRVLVSDNGGLYVIPFPVVFRSDSWFNSATGEEQDEEVFIEGWRPYSAALPQAAARPDDAAARSE